MRYSCRASVEYDLKVHHELRAKYISELQMRSEYSTYCLKTSRSIHGKTYYSVKRPGQTKYKYVGSANHPEVNAVRECAFYKKAIDVIDVNIDAMQQFLAIYRNTSAENINELLARVYTLPPEAAALLSDNEVAAWLRENNDIKNSYPVFDPAGLKVIAFDGTLVRSRAEAAHHEAFYIYGVPDIFERPYEIGNEVLRPDFTALDVFTMSSAILEHLGNWFHTDKFKRDRYRTDSIHRIDSYTKIGFYPESNLLLTYGADDNNFDIQSIHRKIAMLAAPPPSPETIDLLKRV